MQKNSFERHRFPSELIVHAVWLYARFTLSFRYVEDLLSERGLDVSHETIRRWFLKFGERIACNLRIGRSTPSDHWHLDEMAIVIRGKRHWLCRAVDNEGMVLDFLVQSRRNTEAAIKLMKSLLKKQRMSPTLIVTDKLRSYHAAFRAFGLSASISTTNEPTIEQKTLTSPCEEGSERCSGSNHKDLLNGSSMSNQQLITISTSNAISSSGLCSRS